LSWFTQQETLEQQTTEYNDDVKAAFPQLATGWAAEQKGKILLPSSLNSIQIEDMQYLKLANAELDIRVGIGHDLLEEIRMATGLHNYYSRKQMKSSRGQHEMQKVAKASKTVSKQKSTSVQQYIQNWNHMQDLVQQVSEKDVVARLQGLKAIQNNESFSFFLNPDETMKMTNPIQKPSWIWQMTLPSTNLAHGIAIHQDLVSDWESEGLFLMSEKALADIKNSKTLAMATGIYSTGTLEGRASTG